jgi:predicted TIM-barrel fold metal-dependent hydrolase
MSYTRHRPAQDIVGLRLDAWHKISLEQPIRPEQKIIDAHHHLWDRCRMPGYTNSVPTHRRYLADEFFDDVAQSGHCIINTVFVECLSMYDQDSTNERIPGTSTTSTTRTTTPASSGSSSSSSSSSSNSNNNSNNSSNTNDPGGSGGTNGNSGSRNKSTSAVPSAGEVEFAQGIAAQSKSNLYGQNLRCCGAIVGFIDLTQVPASKVGHDLDCLISSGKNFRGIRHAYGYHEAIEIPANHHPTRAMKHLLSDPAFRNGFKELAKRELIFDAWGYHDQLKDLVSLAQAFPNTRIVVDHLGKWRQQERLVVVV